MASANTMAAIYARKKTLSELECAQNILLDSTLEGEDVREQQLAEVGFTFQIRSVVERERYILILEKAIEIKSGLSTPGGRGHFLDFSKRAIE